MAKGGSQKSNRKARAPNEDDTEPGKDAKVPAAKRDDPILWERNSVWTWAAINFLTENPAFRIKLFSDSTAQAKAEGRRKVSNGTGAAQLYQQMAEAVFSDIPEMKAKYEANPTKYGKSMQQHFSR